MGIFNRKPRSTVTLFELEIVVEALVRVLHKKNIIKRSEVQNELMDLMTEGSDDDSIST